MASSSSGKETLVQIIWEAGWALKPTGHGSVTVVSRTSPLHSVANHFTG